MATYRSDCSRDALHVASQGGNAWGTLDGYFYSGKDGTYYRSRVSFTTGDFVGADYAGQRFVVSLTVNSTSSPCGCWGVLHTRGDFVTNDIMNSGLTGPNTTITDDCVGQSCAYELSDASKESTGTNKSKGYTFYFSFPSDSIQPNTQYYLYCCYKSGRGSGTGWVKCNASDVNAWVEYTPMWELHFNELEGVAWVDGGGTYYDGEIATSYAQAEGGYLLDFYQGTTADGSQDDYIWYDCNGLDYHVAEWTMTANRYIDVNAYPTSHSIVYHLCDDADSLWWQEYMPGNGEMLYDITPERDGYWFVGWRDPDEDSIWFPGEYIPDDWGDKELYAEWELMTYTVHFCDYDNGICLEPITLPYGDSVYLDFPECNEYLTQRSVNTTYDSQGGSFTPNPDVTIATFAQRVIYFVDDDGIEYEPGGWYQIDKDTTLTLVWGDKEIWDAEPIQLPYAEKVGHSLDGWYTSPTGGSKVISPYYALEDCTLYARWEANTYRVVIYDHEENPVVTLNTKYGDTVCSPFYL